MTIELNMYQTLAMAVIVLVFGTFLKHRIKFLEKFCIPSPVIGGIIFAILTCVCYSTGIAEFVFDDTLREVCMVFFFTSVGFQANLKVIKSGGKSLIIFLVLLISMIILQNLLALGLSEAAGDADANQILARGQPGLCRAIEARVDAVLHRPQDQRRHQYRVIRAREQQVGRDGQKRQHDAAR